MASFGPGIIIVPNETDTNGGATISAADGAFIAGGITLGTGEIGAILSNGIFCIGDKGLTGHITSIPIYNPSLSLRGTAVPFTPSAAWSVRQGMTSDYVSTFYASVPNGGSETDVRSFSDTGVTGGTTWHITTGAPLILCLSQDGSTFFYSTYNLGAQAIRKWDLGSDTSAGTLIAGVAGTDWGQDMLRLPGTNQFIIIAQTAGPVFTVRRYDESGTLLKSYVLTGITHEASPTRLAIDLASSSVFWVRTFNDITSATTKFWQFDVASGTLLDSFTIPNDSGSPSEVPFSCPFFAWSGPVNPPWPLVPPFVAGEAGLETVAQRRLRVSPHLVSSEQFNIFYDQFTLDLQVGNGVLVGQGVNPQIMLRMSDDGGYTWSDEILLDSGAQGQYLTRVTANGLGMARDRVFEISTSDPVAWSIIGAYLNTRKGRW